MGKTWKRDSNFKTKNFFDPIRLSRIYEMITSRDYHNALRLIEQYIGDYPDDNVAPLYKARILVGLNRKEEAEQLAEYAYYHGTFHNDSAKVNAALIYSNILRDLKKFEECEAIYEGTIQKYKVYDKVDEFNIFIHDYFDYLIDNKRFSLVADIIGSHSELLKNNSLAIRRALALVNTEQSPEAIRLLNSLPYDEIQDDYKDFVYGRAYFQLGIDARPVNLKYLKKAEKYLLKSLGRKNQRYYSICYNLSVIYRTLGNLDGSLKYINFALQYCNDYPQLAPDTTDDLYSIQARVYEDMFQFDKALVSINKIKSEYLRNRLLVRYCLLTDDYNGVLEYGSHVLSNPILEKTDERIEDCISVVIIHMIYSYIRLNEYEKAENLFVHTQDAINIGDKEKIKVFLDLLQYRVPQKSYYYYSKQMMSYSMKKALKHIYTGHINSDAGSFKNRKEVEEAFNYALEQLPNYKAVGTLLSDEYHIPSNGYGNLDGERADTLIVITIPNTHNIITMYPAILNAREPVQIVEAKKEYKRESQIDKFNRRYGTY